MEAYKMVCDNNDVFYIGQTEHYLQTVLLMNVYLRITFHKLLRINIKLYQTYNGICILQIHTIFLAS